ncbi:MAG: hypothetical protein KIH67_002350 [Candidatus Moranbacteria bacterium]|nr:hypothetical protein [Candidatus Moranbacteria bacterium]
MITYQKPSLDNIQATFRKGVSFVAHKWQEFQSKEHSRKEWLLIFTLALIVGMTGKVVAIKTFTIGYEDYLISKTHTPIALVEDSAIAQGPICEE